MGSNRWEGSPLVKLKGELIQVGTDGWHTSIFVEMQFRVAMARILFLLTPSLIDLGIQESRLLAEPNAESLDKVMASRLP